MLALMMNEFQRRVAGTKDSGILFSCGNPGATRTGNVAQVGVFGKVLLDAFGSYIMKTPEEGARVLLWLATGNDVPQHFTIYDETLKQINLPDKLKNENDAKILWENVEQELNLKPYPARI